MITGDDAQAEPTGTATEPSPAEEPDEESTGTEYVVLATSLDRDGFIVDSERVTAHGATAAKRAWWELVKADGRHDPSEPLIVAVVPARSWNPSKMVERAPAETQLVIEEAE